MPGSVTQDKEHERVWNEYREAVLEFPAARMTIDLRRAISDDAREGLRQLGPDKSFAVVTAENPHGRDAEPALNERRARELEDELRRRGVRFVRADGCSANQTHRERGVALWLDRETALEVARSRAQLALYWFDGDAFWLVPAAGGREAERLPGSGVP
ncbi:MAG: DUF3293 domain-containing protein [Gemmatimonadetes bacterium]|nr:DUF3293 domain-containing protein [Gemmatimonadota bacterium]